MWTFDLYSLNSLICIAIGGVGVLTIEHGWGWVLAKWHAGEAKAAADFGLMVANANGPLAVRLANVEQRLGIPTPAAAVPAATAASPSPTPAAPGV